MRFGTSKQIANSLPTINFYTFKIIQIISDDNKTQNKTQQFFKNHCKNNNINKIILKNLMSLFQISRFFKKARNFPPFLLEKLTPA